MIPRKQRAARKMRLSSRLMKKHMAMLVIRVRGARTAMRMIIWKAFCTLVTSVVSRVTSPAVLNLSMLENEKSWMRAYMLSRRLQAKPDEALAAKRPAMAPANRLTAAMATIMAPQRRMAGISDRARPLSMIFAVTKGRSTSMTTSRAVKPMVRKVSFLYCFS